MYKNILVAYNGSQKSNIALDRALKSAKDNGASLTMVWVRDPLLSNPLTVGEVDEDIESAGVFFNKLRAEVEQRATLQETPFKCAYLKGDAANVIAKYAKENGIDLIFVDRATNPARLFNFVVTTVPEKLEKISPCEVIVV